MLAWDGDCPRPSLELGILLTSGRGRRSRWPSGRADDADVELLFLVGCHGAFPVGARDLDGLADQFDRLLDQRQHLELRLCLCAVPSDAAVRFLPRPIIGRSPSERLSN